MRNLFPLLLILGFVTGCSDQKDQRATAAPSEAVKPAKILDLSPGETVKLAVVGLTHGHVGFLNGWKNWEGIELVGLVDPDPELTRRVAENLDFPVQRTYRDMEALVAKEKVHAVAAFGSTYDHLAVTEFCAPRGLHLMVEKPLAVNWEHAARMLKLAEHHRTRLLVNYETSWMSGVREARRVVAESTVGKPRRLVFRTGHMGPAKIDLPEEFLDWLTDPELNGGGALTDFGCYGANLSTWLLEGASPVAVSCLTENLQPEHYPRVEDAATLMLEYPATQVIVQASWNWPHHVKDMDVYGDRGYVLQFHRDSLTVRPVGNDPTTEMTYRAPAIASPHDSPFRHFADVITGGEEEAYNPYSEANNRIVMRVLEAAKVSAREGRRVVLGEID